MGIDRTPRRWAIGLCAGAAVALGLLAGPAVAAAAGTYSATISPTAVSAGTTSTYTVTVTNTTLGGVVGINNATVTVPAGFTGISVGSPSPSSWTASYNAGTRTVTLSSGLLLPGTSVSVPVTATAPTALGTYTWTTTASSLLFGAATRTGPEPTVQVASSAIVCPANQSCDSGQLSAPASGGTLATKAEVVANSGPAADELVTSLPDPVTHTMSCQQANFGAIVTWNVAARSTTLTYTVTSPNDEYLYDTSDTCFGSTKPFTTANGTPAQFNSANSEYEGTIPMCSGTHPAPCVASITNQSDPDEGRPHEVEEPPGPATFVINAPIGDPKYTG